MKKILIQPSVFVLVWIPLSLTAYFPSVYYPYIRSDYLGFAVILAVVCSLLSFLFSRHIDIKGSKLKFNLKRENTHLQFVKFVILYIAIFDIIGFLLLEDSVFDSKTFLDNVNFIKFPINFKVYTGIVLGLLDFKRVKGLLWIHLIVSFCFSLLFAERLHIMEFIFAFLFGKMLSSRVIISAFKAFILVVAGALSFMFFEFTRNFYVIYILRGKVISFSDAIYNLMERLMSYYGDTINKFAVVIEFRGEVDFVPAPYLYWTYNQLTKSTWWFSGVSVGDFADVMGYSYENLTNQGAFALFWADFGVLSLLPNVLFGTAASYFYYRAKIKSDLVYAIIAYVMLINILEYPRLLYAFNIRGYYSLVLIIVLNTIFRRRASVND